LYLFPLVYNILSKKISTDSSIKQCELILQILYVIVTPTLILLD
jgi:hypothetical protein